MRIEIVIYEGFDEMDAIAPYEVLRSAATSESANFEVVLVNAAGAGLVTAANGLQLLVSEELGHPDALIVPGGGWGDRAGRGAWAEVQRGALPRRIAEVASNCQWVASVCTGAMLLAAAELTNGRPAITHHAAIDDLAASGAHVIEGARVVDDGDLLTGAGITSGLDLALWIVEREAGGALASRVARLIEHERSSAIWTREKPLLASQMRV